MKISIICALGSNGAIGRGNELLWRISEDLKRFKRITTGHAIIMGRKTYESIGRPLPNRTNIILTRDESYKADGCVVVHSLDDALAVAGPSAPLPPSPKGYGGTSRDLDGSDTSGSLSGAEMPRGSLATDEVFIVGGGEIYQQFIGMTERLYLTLVDDAPADADTFFSDYSDFTRVVASVAGKSADLSYRFITLER